MVLGVMLVTGEVVILGNVLLATAVSVRSSPDAPWWPDWSW